MKNFLILFTLTLFSIVAAAQKPAPAKPSNDTASVTIMLPVDTATQTGPLVMYPDGKGGFKAGWIQYNAVPSTAVEVQKNAPNISISKNTVIGVFDEGNTDIVINFSGGVRIHVGNDEWSLPASVQEVSVLKWDKTKAGPKKLFIRYVCTFADGKQLLVDATEGKYGGRVAKGQEIKEMVPVELDG